MENIQRIADTIKEFASNPTVASGIDFATSTLDFIGNYVGLIIFAIIGLGVLQWRKKFKVAEALSKTGFQGMVVSKAFVNKKNGTIKVMGMNINGLGMGDIVAFDKDPFQTKCKVGALNLITDNDAVKYSWGGAAFPTGKIGGTNAKSMSLTYLFNLAKKGIQAVQSSQTNAPTATIENGKSAGANESEGMMPFTAARDFDVKITPKPVPVSNEMIVLEFGNPTEFSRLLESQAIGQGNRKVLKAKDLKLVLREKAKKTATVIPEIVRNK